MPLDPDYPQERLAYMLQDTQAKVILTQATFKEQLRELTGPDTVLIALDGDWEAIAAHAQAARRDGIDVRSLARPDSLAYVIYTSGSTGRPKGVMIEHRGLVNHNQCVRRRYGVGRHDVQIQIASASFDLFAEEVFSILLSGAHLVLEYKERLLASEDLARVIRDNGVTILNVPTAFFHQLVAVGLEPGSVKTIVVGGEKLDHARAGSFCQQYPEIKLINTYGPTETTIISAMTDVTPELLARHASVPIGAPLDNTQIYVLDTNGCLQAIGVPGELTIGGHGIARGYWNLPEMSAEKFVANPFRPGERMYRTGDLARWLDDGNLQYLGRMDTQVKVRGFRIELGEIETRLNAHPLVEDSVVVAHGADGDRRLAAFYVIRPDADLGQEVLRQYLLDSLPSYMVPAVFSTLAQIPMTPNGKVDRRALERIEVSVQSLHSYVAPRGDTEQRLAALWEQVLDLETGQAGANDSFFDLGGHSLLATQLLSRLRKEFGIEQPLKVLFETRTLAELACAIDLALGQRGCAWPLAVIAPVDRDQMTRLPLSYAQERLWFLEQLAPGHAAYNAAGAITLRGDLDLDALEDAFRQIIARHESLRTVFPVTEGRASQLIVPVLAFHLERIDLRGKADRAHSARELCLADAAAPFDLATGPLMRAMVITLASDERILMLNMHHIITDGWSFGVLFREMELIMQAQRLGQTAQLHTLPIQYVDYSVWQRKRLEEEGLLEQQLAYWKKKLADVPEQLDLPTDFPRPSVHSLAGATHRFSLPLELSGALSELAEQHGVTLFMVLLSAFNALLYRYSGQADLCVGSPIANRQYGETEGLIGMFVNTLALRTHVDGQQDFLSLLAQVRNTCLEAYEHQDAPFEKVVDAVQPQRNLAVNPLFQVLLVLQNNEARGGADQIQPYPLDLGISKFDFSLELTEGPHGLACAAEYSTALFGAETIDRLCRHFGALCRAIIAAPTGKIDELQYMEAIERAQLLGTFNATALALPSGRLVHQLFERQAHERPNALALVAGDMQLSYGELNHRANQLAHALIKLGVRPDDRVAICAARGSGIVLAQLAILKAGAAYVPLDPAYPFERLRYMLEDSAPVVLLAQRALLGLLPAPAMPVILLDTDDFSGSPGHNPAPANLSLEPENLAYVIYTSGSSGQPKGVMVEHRNLFNLVMWHCKRFALTPGSRSSSLAGLAFDACVWEIWPSLCGGGTLLLPPPETVQPQDLLAWWRQQALDVSFLVTPLAEHVLHDDVGNRHLRTLLTGGDRLRRLPAVWPSCALVNNYGPTETTVVATSGQLNADDVAVHIGRPIANTQIYILDPHMQLVPVGVAGEMYIGGAGVARGYLNRQDLTEERFMADPFNHGGRMYRSGDLARWLPDGNIDYLGRNDFQVKIRGFRIELGEIEAKLNACAGVREAVVIVREEQPGDKRLVAYLLAQDGTVPQASQLRAELLASLAEYMVPGAFVLLDSFPLTPNGKLDRKALPAPDPSSLASTAYQAPQGASETALAVIWQELLGVEKVGRHDQFFELGGHSLLAVQLMARIASHFGQTLPLASLFQHADIAMLGAALDSQAACAFQILVPIQPKGQGRAVFAVPGAGGNVLSFAPLSRAIDHIVRDEQRAAVPFYGLQAAGLDGTEPAHSVAEAAEQNIQAMRAQQAHGPYCLIGHSYGGVVAYEMARRLLERGESVSSLVLLDSLAPACMQAHAGEQHAVELLMDMRATFARTFPDLPLELDGALLQDTAREQWGELLADALQRQGLPADGAQLHAFLRVFDANVASYRSYQPEPLSDKVLVTLLRAGALQGGTTALPDDYGWGDVLGAAPQLHYVEGDHMSMLDGDHALQLAGRLIGLLPV
ncbi:amino acid adenylation domain-containing protein [Janthinobacterium sp. FT14W]|uniref:amino acid adenylation domain-containing protein n=1 Tax=Janthinobacterium sp. FT14W TaxID=2654253 RepID=UPI001D0139E4|nr:non-ribosomal peptide synthetase [Janthinobacterium sp. FT14W]